MDTILHSQFQEGSFNILLLSMILDGSFLWMLSSVFSLMGIFKNHE